MNVNKTQNKTVNGKELETLKFWNENNIFEKSIFAPESVNCTSFLQDQVHNKSKVIVKNNRFLSGLMQANIIDFIWMNLIPLNN